MVHEPYYHKDESAFIHRFIAPNRGQPLFLIRFERIRPHLGVFAMHLHEKLHALLGTVDVDAGMLSLPLQQALLLCIAPRSESGAEGLPNIDRVVGRFQDECLRSGTFLFDFGIGRTQCNFLSGSYEIYRELFTTSLKNLNDNLVRRRWTLFNRANTYLSGAGRGAMIQPTVAYDAVSRTYSVKGGELFIGGGGYQSYRDLLGDLPDDQDVNRFELLILEKLLLAANGLPGVLKFNISPQSLLDTFEDPMKIKRFVGLLRSQSLQPESVLLELVEQHYNEERGSTLKEVCRAFWDEGVGFAADDFGLKSQSHQVVLELGVMIREFKLDPMSFRFKEADDQTKFLDNLAFLVYCKRLADNREAVITAEAVEDLDTLQFLMEHHIYQFQSNLFCGKIPVDEYRELYLTMQHLPGEDFERCVEERGYEIMRRHDHNVFECIGRQQEDSVDESCANPA